VFTTRYGLTTRRTALRYVCLEGSGGFVTSTAASIASGWNDQNLAGRDLHPMGRCALPRRTIKNIIYEYALSKEKLIF
jgi:hypothetical protein